jgi:glyceraldehyde 3-phosphate dehydrogenase
VHINEVAGGPETAAHLLTFDSVHGRWDRRVDARADQIAIEGIPVAFSTAAKPADVPWSNQAKKKARSRASCPIRQASIACRWHG